MTSAGLVFVVVCVAMLVLAAASHLLADKMARAALRGTCRLPWHVGCTIGPLLSTALLGVVLAVITIAFQATNALHSEASKDIVVPVMVGVLAAAVYDQLVHLGDAYWRAIDDSLDEVLNPSAGTAPNEEQKLQFNRTRLNLLQGPRRDRSAVLREILQAHRAPTPPVAHEVQIPDTEQPG